MLLREYAPRTQFQNHLSKKNGLYLQDLLQVKTPKLDAKDLALSDVLESHMDKLIPTTNATVFQGVLEFLHEENPIDNTSARIRLL